MKKEEEKLNEYELRQLVIKQRERHRKNVSMSMTILLIVALISTILWGILHTQ